MPTNDRQKVIDEMKKQLAGDDNDPDSEANQSRDDDDYGPLGTSPGEESSHDSTIDISHSVGEYDKATDEKPMNEEVGIAEQIDKDEKEHLEND